jgi:hypothetical protein
MVDRPAQLVAAMLEGVGLSVEVIPESQTDERADLRASDRIHGCIIEVKTKEDDADEIAKYLRTLEATGRASRSTPMGRSNRISAIFKKAVAQLRATPSQPGDFLLVWLMAAGRDQRVQRQQFLDTLYGTVPIIVSKSATGGAPASPDVRRSSTATAVPCYFYSFNEFFGTTDVDGAFVSDDEGVTLCVNPHGKRLHEFRQTQLHVFFQKQRAVVDPALLEEEGKAFIADSNIDRRQGLKILQYIRQKYGLDRHAIPFQGTTHVMEAVVRLPPSE